MSYRKAEQLLALATLASGRHVGVTLDDVIERFGVSKRTAQRMLRALETVFPDTASAVDEQGRKRWRLPSAALRDLMTLSAEELATLDLAIETMRRSGLSVDAEDLLSLREKIMALVPRSKAARLETDQVPILAVARARLPLPVRAEILGEATAGLMLAHTRLTGVSSELGFETTGSAYAPVVGLGAEMALTLKPGRLVIGLRYLWCELGRTSQGDVISGNSAGLIGDIGYRMTF